MENYYGKIGIITGLSSFVLLVVGLRNVLGQDVEVLNFIAFSVFGLIIGIICATLLFYKLKIAFSIFIVALIIAFFEMFRNYIQNSNGQGDLIGILSLFIISSFGLVLAVGVNFVLRLYKKYKEETS